MIRSTTVAETQLQPPRVEQIEVPQVVHDCSSLGRLDYADAFRVQLHRGDARTAEEWMRAILEDAPAPMRVQLLTGWTALGLRLSRPGRDGTILGWRLRQSDLDRVRVGASSRLGMPAELLVLREAGSLLFSTCVRFDSVAGRAAWATVEPIHPPIVKRLLMRAAARPASDEPSA